MLSDPETRRRYDAFGPTSGRCPRTWTPRRGGARRAGAAGRSRRRGGPGAGPGGFSFSEDDIDLEDLLGGIFGGRFGGPAGPGRRGADPGRRPGGRARAHRRGGLPWRAQVRSRCPATAPAATFDVTIPAGVTDGQRIRLAGQGGRGSDGARNGDLYLVVRIAPHPRYRLDGRDLYVELRLAPWEAALGTSVAGGHPGRRGQGQGPGRDLERPAAPAARAGACPTPGASRATCTRRRGSWCRPGSRAPSGGCSSSWPPNPISIRGSSGELRA